MRRAAKVDANQPEIVQALRDAGWSVAVMSAVGQGFPDLVIGRDGVNVLVEVKDGSKPPSAQKLTPDQVEFHAAWNGRIEVVNSVESALQLRSE
jgi:Holliday junction resolvase